jgi:hypothetical protein
VIIRQIGARLDGSWLCKISVFWSGESKKSPFRGFFWPSRRHSLASSAVTKLGGKRAVWPP